MGTRPLTGKVQLIIKCNGCGETLDNEWTKIKDGGDWFAPGKTQFKYNLNNKLSGSRRGHSSCFQSLPFFHRPVATPSPTCPRNRHQN
eukprot:7388797-Prymnesium_polylepis.1